MKLTGKPDNKNGYTTVAHELLEVMALYPFTKSDYKVLLVIIRQTYGWKVKRKKLSYRIIAKATGLTRRQVKRTIDKLVKDKVIFRESNRLGSVFGLNKYYLNWSLWTTLKDMDTDVHRVLTEVSIPSDKNVHTSVDTGVHTLPSSERKERNIYKENFKERDNFSKSYLFKNKTEKRHLKEPVRIGEVIKSII